MCPDDDETYHTGDNERRHLALCSLIDCWLQTGDKTRNYEVWTRPSSFPVSPAAKALCSGLRAFLSNVTSSLQTDRSAASPETKKSWVRKKVVKKLAVEQNFDGKGGALPKISSRRRLSKPGLERGVRRRWTSSATA
jgi:hypothetical protein